MDDASKTNIIQDSLERLDYLEELKDCTPQLMDLICALKVELRFLRTFDMCRSMKKILHKYSIDRIKKITDLMLDVGEVINSLYVKAMDDGEVAIDLYSSLFSLLDKFELMIPEVHLSYREILGLQPILIYGAQRIKLIDSVLENLKDLLQFKVDLTAGVKKVIHTIENSLRFRKSSLQFSEKLMFNNKFQWDIFAEVQYVAPLEASFFLSCWINKMDDKKARQTESIISSTLDYMLDKEGLLLRDVIFQPSHSLELDTKGDLLVGYIDFLFQHLEEFLCRNGNLELPAKDQLERICEELKLSGSLLTTTMPHAEHEKSYKQHTGDQVNKLACLIGHLYLGHKHEEIMILNEDILLPMLGRLKLINLYCIIERLNHETSLIAPMDDQLEALCENIRVLVTFYYEYDGYNGTCKRIEDMALVAGGHAIYSFLVNGIKEDKAEEMSCLLNDLFENIKLIKANMRQITYSPDTPSHFPKTNGQRGISVSFKELNELLNSRADKKKNRTVTRLKRKPATILIENLQDKLQWLIPFLDKFEEKCIEMGELKDLEIGIMNMSDKAKFVSEDRFFNYNPLWYCMLKFSDIMEEVMLIKKEIERINMKFFDEMLSSQDNNTLAIIGEVIVGFKDEAQNMIERLIEGPEQLNIISIIGMGGLGKTTLAKKLYNHPSVVSYFHVKAWCSVSQEYRAEQMLNEILGQVSEKSNVICVEGLDERLYKSLKGRRYLIVMDDIWDIKAWSALSRCFADDCNGSRVIFTTRIEKIALNNQARNSIPYHLRYFNEDESLELLQKKLFPGKRCPTEQLESVKQIAKNCQGLPLAVVLMAGVLARKTREDWKEVAESLSPHTNRDLQTLSMKVLELSYTNLPGYLRECFLYFAGFPEDREIAVKKLMWLWVSEGLIHKGEHKSLEDLAKDYLMDLIGRSLVTVAEIASNGGVKTCRIHDLLLDLSLRKAKEEQFLLLLDGKGEPSAHPNNKFHQKVESSNSNPITDKRYRLCIHSMPHDIDKWASDEDVCSLLCHLNMKLSYDASFFFSIFKFLNVLDLERLLLKDLNCGIELLVQLRLLAVRIQSNIIPESISKLSNLETFIVQGIRGEIDIPDKVWSMVSLRHLHVDKRASLVWGKRDGKHSALDKLETLSTPSLPCGDSSRDVISLLLNLHKLKCIFIDVDSDNNFLGLRSLIQLESLKVLYYGRKVSHGTFSFPQNLKKLTLSKFQLPWSDIATIGNLPNLEVLKLLFKAFDGKEWKTRDDEFPKLKYLKLESLDIEQWNVASEDHFPRLEKLVVHRCKQLEEIPFCFADMNTLHTIEVKWCNLSASNSAQEIYKNRLEEMDDERFKVITHPNPSDHGLASSS